MTDERKPSEGGLTDPEREPQLDREDIKDLTPPDEAAGNIRGGLFTGFTCRGPTTG